MLDTSKEKAGTESAIPDTDSLLSKPPANTSVGANAQECKPLGPLELRYNQILTAVGIPIIKFMPNDTYPSGWEKSTVENNEAAINSTRALAALLGKVNVVGIDVDTKNGADIEATRKSLTDAGIIIRAEIETPSGGRLFLVCGPADTPTLHAYPETKDKPRVDALIGLPGVEVLGRGANIGVPGQRISRKKWEKYTQAPYNIEDPRYRVVALNNLELILEDDPQVFVDWLEATKFDRETPDYKHKKVTHELQLDDYTMQSQKRLRSYAEAALYDQAHELAMLDVGSRNNFLNSSACKVYHYEWILGAEVIENWLHKAAEDSGLETKEIKNTLDSGYRASIYEQWLPRIADFILETIADRKALRIEQIKIDIEAREEAQRLIADEVGRNTPKFDLYTLGSILERPEEPMDRVHGMVPWNAFSLLVAQAKVGKTTFVMNMARALMTGEDFLGKFPVVPIAPDAKVAMMNYEVTWSLIRLWATRIGVDPNRLVLVDMRGKRNPLRYESDRKRLAASLREQNVETLIVDPLTNAFTGGNIDKDLDIVRFYEELNMFSRNEVGASDLILTAHAGHDGTRPRGSSEIMGGVDCYTVIQKKDGLRTLTSTGRTNDIDPHFVFMNPDTFELRAASQVETAQQNKADKQQLLDEKMLSEAVKIITENPGLAVSDITEKMKEAGFPSYKLRASDLMNIAEANGQIKRLKKDKDRHTYHYPV